MKKLTAYLVARADGQLRVVNRNPRGRLRWDEVAVPVRVEIPDAWGEVRAEDEVVIRFPEPPTIEQEKESRA